MKSNRFWIIIFCVIVILSGITIFLFEKTQGDIARIYLNGQLIDSIDLSEVSEPFAIKTEFGGGTNTIEIEQGRIRVVYANCLDGSCVRLGWNAGSPAPIVCLPNRLVILVESRIDIDAIVG